MRKIFAKRDALILSRDRPGRMNGKHGRRRPRLHWLVSLVLASLSLANVSAQDVKLRSQPEARDRDRRALREQWFLRGRSLPGQPGAAQRYRAYLQKMRMRGARPATVRQNALPSSGVVWIPLGPAPLASDASGSGEDNYGWVSGRATAVAVDPADPTGNTVYIGGAYGGVWKSTNATQAVTPTSSSVTWTALTDNQATLAVGAITIQPGNNNSNNSVILVGTGETNSSADSYYGLGILRSTDAGATWTLIPSDTTKTRSFAGMGFSKIAFNSTSSNIAVAGTAGASEGIIEGLANPLTANLGLYYSSDSGNSWSYANVSDSGVATAPGSATSVVYNAGAGLFFAALRSHGFYSSVDSINWTRLITQPGGGLTATACPANPSSSSCPIYRGEIAVVPGRNEMYVWYVDANDFDQGIWESTDGGSSWTQINDAGIINCGDELGCGTEQGTYNLELAAVPNGNSGVTDLYAGTINLYKCEISGGFPACDPNATGAPPDATFLNLTHAYGCSAIAEVHPAQHAVSFLLVNGNTQDVMYFANDGGIYRALDGYTGLTTGTCGGSNQFDSLNMTLGSMTQFVSFSEAGGDGNTILGGTQGNGSPGTQSALASDPLWQNVNFGDGGYTQISPDNELLWFVSNPPDSISGVNIFSCASGINCHTQDFQNHPVVDSETLGGDTGAYYPPYILDPQSSGELIVGTCRMWRGLSTGGAYTVLSHSFETGGDGICTGGEINLVRSLVAGGVLDNNGFSNVIYAGTDGFGPLIPSSPPGGHVWVSTNVAGGASTWVDQTGSINPSNFPISGIAMDTSDKSGLTAYVSIMGFSTTDFPTSHVWQTTNGGSSWNDFTANLPDAPANAVLVDPGSMPTNGTVYVATDVGVFSSSTAAPNWTEVGPVPNSGQPGYLPNVAVTALGMFIDSAGNKWLRASTYGRGVWQLSLVATPDFFLTISNTPQTVYVGQEPAVFNGEAFAIGGYNLPVSLTCVAGATQPPHTCSLPSNVTPTESGASFQLSASDVAQDYSFAVQGTDQNKVTRQAPVTLKVVDFGLTPPSPGSITVGPGSNSGPVGFQVTAAGSFQDTVNLSCVVPKQLRGMSCNFQPSGAVNPTTKNPVAVTLTLTATANQPQATGSITIEGAVANGYNKTQNLTVTIPADYSLAISNPALQAEMAPGGTFPVYYDGILTTPNGYSNLVNLSCSAGATPPPSTCSAAPAIVTPAAPPGAPFTVAVASNQCSPPNTPPHTPFSFNIEAQGTDASKLSHTFPVTFTVTSFSQDDFTLEITNTPLTAPVNTPAIFNGTLTGTVCYNSPVKLSCGSGAPPTCSTPTSVTPTVQGTPFTVTVETSDQCGNYSFEIVAQGTDPARTMHKFLVSFASSSVSQANFSLTISNPSLTAAVNTPATFKGTLTASACYNSPVNLSCGSDHPPTCTPLPATATPTATGTPFNVTVSSNVNQTYNFNVAGVGKDPLQLQRQQPVTFTSGGGGSGPTFSFTVTPTPSTESQPAGQPAQFDLDVKPSGGTFPNNVALSSSSNCPPLSTCTFSSSAVIEGSGETHVFFTITTTAPVVAAVRPLRALRPLLYALWLSLPGLIVIFTGVGHSGRRRKRFVFFVLLTLVVPGLWLGIACSSGLQGNGTGGGNGQPGTPSGPYTMTVSATMSSSPPLSAPPAKVTLNVN